MAVSSIPIRLDKLSVKSSAADYWLAAGRKLGFSEDECGNRTEVDGFFGEEDSWTHPRFSFWTLSLDLASGPMDNYL